jgi:hypothetical protein
MRPFRSTARLFGYLTRSRVAWLVLSVIVIGDTIYWAADRNGAGLVPAFFNAALPAPACRIFCWQPYPFIIVLPPDETGRRRFVDAYGSPSPTDAEHLAAEYWVRGIERVDRRGLWAPCVRYQTAHFRISATGWPPPTAPPPPGLEQAALDWFAAQPQPTEADAAWAAETVARLRAGDLHTLLWPGIIHDAAMLPLALLWLPLTVRHLVRFVSYLAREHPDFLRFALDSRAHRRRARGLCPRCAYDLANCGFARCPECGTELDQGASPPLSTRNSPHALRPDPADHAARIP